MKIWFTEIGEPLPIESNVRLHRYGMLTKELAGLGHDVVWWTSSFSHAIKRHIVEKDKDLNVDGVNLKILKSQGYKKNISLQRILHQRKFAERFYALSKNYDTPDIIVSPIPTIEIAFTSMQLARDRNIPILIDIRDEWPDEFVDLSPTKLRWLTRLLLKPYFNKMSFICKNATGIVGVSKSFMNYGLSFAGRSEGNYDGVFPIGYTTEQIDTKKIKEAKEWWIAQGLRVGSFTCCFFGTIGKFFNLETIIEAVRILEKEFDIQIVLCGDGSSLDRYKKMASFTGSILFPGWIDSPQIAALMAYADIGLAPYASDSRMSLPNKPFEYFAGGLPVISSIQGEMKYILHKYDCGVTYNADSIEQLCVILRDLYGSPGRRREMGENAKRLLDEQFSIPHIARDFEHHMVKIMEQHRVSGK